MEVDPPARPTRRRALSVLAAGVAAVAVGGAGAAGVAAAEPRLWHRARAAVGWPERGPDASPASSGAAVGVRESGTFTSAACGREVGWQLALPPGTVAGDPLPVALVLHGRGGSATTAFTGLALDGFLADAVASGTPPFALACAAAGDGARP